MLAVNARFVVAALALLATSPARRRTHAFRVVFPGCRGSHPSSHHQRHGQRR